jgi:hypothetical protein
MMFDATSIWRIEATENNEKNCKQLIEKMAAAAAALGWPEQIVDASRTQMLSIIEMQIKTIDRFMGNWEEQLKSPIAAASAAASPSVPTSAKPSGSRAAGSSPNGDVFQMTSMAPIQFWMNFAEQWQKPWADTMASLGQGGKPNDNEGLRGHRT